MNWLGAVEGQKTNILSKGRNHYSAPGYCCHTCWVLPDLPIKKKEIETLDFNVKLLNFLIDENSWKNLNHHWCQSLSHLRIPNGSQGSKFTNDCCTHVYAGEAVKKTWVSIALFSPSTCVVSHKIFTKETNNFQTSAPNPKGVTGTRFALPS